ncbi:MAG: response regulator [Gammaproteobacteria bacterium]|nr:response regulator [Gammaproteobacteria bacterium]
MDVLSSRSPKFWTFLICLMFGLLVIVAAFSANQVRSQQFASSYENMFRQDLQVMLRAQTGLTQQALLTVNLLKEHQQLTQILTDAAKIGQNADSAASLQAAREELHQIIQPYWQYLQQQGVKLLHFHLAPNAFTLYRAHRPDFHSDILADVRPLVMAVLRSAQPQTGLEVGRHGLGLRAVVPLMVDGKVIAAIEVGYGLAGLIKVEQNPLAAAESVENNMALLLHKSLLPVMTTELRESFNLETQTSWLSEDTLLNQTKLLSLLPQRIEKPMFMLLESESKQFLVSLQPWAQFDQTAAENRVVLLSWHDMTNIAQQRASNDLFIYMIWLVILVVGVLLVFFISNKLQTSTAAMLTEQQRDLRWSQQKLNALFELSPDAILLNRLSDGVYLDANPAMTQLTGYSFDELKKLSYFDLTPQVYAQQEQEQLRLLHETGRYGPYRKQYRHKNGELVDIELRGVKFLSPTGEEMIWSTISDRREVMKLDRLKQDFISTVSHELRTPLTSVNGSLDLLLSGAAGDLPAKAQKLLAIAVKNNKRLITLVNDLLDMEKLSQGKLAFKPEHINSQSLLQNAIEHNLPFAELHNVSLRLGQNVDVALYIDSDRIQQVLTNLISNAAKFSPQESDILIHSELKPHALRIAVTDQGRGLTAEQISKLFSRFSQLDNTANREQPGSGLGLAISREIMLQSGGQIGVESEVGVGSTFWIELPLAEKPEQAAQSKRILVIEDDADTAFTLKELLGAAGYFADVAHELKQAWLLLQQRHYDLITLDLNLNGESGTEFFLKIRDSAEFSKIPVLVISAYIEQGKLLLNAIAHTIDWLEKPVNTDMLTTKIEYLLSQSRTKLTSARILHVEDDEDIVAIMQMQLEPKFHYHQAGTLAEARAKLRSNRYDLVLLDIGLPDGNGWQLIPDLQLSHAKVPVIVFSAQDVSVNQRNQATAVFGKTKVEPTALVEQIGQMLGVK